MIFLDNNATTPILPEVVRAMMRDLDGIPRNPSSITCYGREGRAMVISARDEIATHLGLPTEEIYFTSGGTESNYLMISAFLSGGHTITTKIEHPSILENLLKKTSDISFANVGRWGAPRISDIEQVMRKNTKRIIISAANGESGVVSNLDDIGDFAESHDLDLLVDGISILGKEDISLKKVTAITFSGHKIHGPKGIGLIVSKAPLPPIILGGQQESSFRAGTENLPGILGISKAISLIEHRPMIPLQKYFEDKITALGAEINGEGPRICNTTNFYIEGINAHALLIYLDQLGIILSTGHACSSHAITPSKVLINMGYSEKRALSSLRLSLSKLNTIEEIDKVIEKIEEYLSRSDSNPPIFEK